MSDILCLCLSRFPTEKELEHLTGFFDDELERFQKDSAAATALVGGETAVDQNRPLNVAHWAAWTMVANVLLNLDETMSKN